jgi:hypothetical protein
MYNGSTERFYRAIIFATMDANDLRQKRKHQFTPSAFFFSFVEICQPNFHLLLQVYKFAILKMAWLLVVVYKFAILKMVKE